MKKAAGKLSVIVVLALIVLSGCKKYPEGPGLSFRSKESRLVNTWKIEAVFVNGTNETETIKLATPDYRQTFTKDGVYSYSSTNATGDGKWEWEENKMKVKINGVNGQSSGTLIIQKLKEKQLWYRIEEGSNTYEYRMIPA